MAKTLLRCTDELTKLRAGLSAAADLTRLEDYLRCRERGLRGRMAKPLAAFAAEASGWSFEDRRALVHWIGEPWIAAAGHEPTSIFPKRGDPVFVAVVSPTLREWRAHEPDDPEPPLLVCLWDELEGEQPRPMGPDGLLYHVRFAQFDGAGCETVTEAKALAQSRVETPISWA